MLAAASLSAVLALAAVLHAAAGNSEPVAAPLEFDDATSEFVTLEKWLAQRDLYACLANSPADVLFLVDSSQSVGLSDFHLVVKSMLVDTISRLKIGEQFVQVGVLVFSDQVAQMVPIGKYADKLQLLAAVSKLEYVGSYTSLDSAVEGSLAELQRRQSQLNAAQGAAAAAKRKRIIVYVTDGWDNHKSVAQSSGLLLQLKAQVNGVMTMGLEKSNSETLQSLSSDPSLVFGPTMYPEYQSSLFNLLNANCADTCYKFQQQRSKLHKIIKTLASYSNNLIRNFATYKRQEVSLVEYIQQVNASTALVTSEIQRSCGKNESELLTTMVRMKEEIEKKSNSSLGGMVSSVFISELLEKANELQRTVSENSRQLADQKVRRDSLQLEKQRLTELFNARLQSKVIVKEAQKASLHTIDERITSYQSELQQLEGAVKGSQNASKLQQTRLKAQENKYSALLKQLKELSQEHSTLLAVKNGGSAQLEQLERQIAFCESFLRNKEAVLFAIRCGSGASFASLFSRDEASFSEDAFEDLSDSLAVYKSPFLLQMHAMGYFSEVTMQFLVGGNVAAKLTMDTRRYELANVFSTTRVTAAFPWVASYVNSAFRSRLSQFRLRPGAEFLLLFGDLSRYRATGNCSDIVGVYVVVDKQHRCFPDATTFPQVYVSPSPYGGALTLRIDEVRLVTASLPTDKQLPSQQVNEQQVSELLLFARAGAGFLQPLLLSGRYSPAATLAEVDDIADLTRHYKSPLLSQVSPQDYASIRVELYGDSAEPLASLVFKGPFEGAHQLHGWVAEAGALRESWSWFQPKYLDRADTFDKHLLKAARFSFNEGKQFFTIGQQMATNCEERLYFMTVVDGDSACACFKNVAKPTIFFANGDRPRTCGELKQATSLRVTGFLKQR